MKTRPPIAALFPGQGSQYVGMAKELKESFPWTREIFEEASDAIGLDLLRLCLEGPAETLQWTENQQPSILVTSYCWFRVLRKNLDFMPAAAAGHSLGEYSALLASGALALADAVKLVRTRGQLMQSAVPLGKGKMAALIGLEDEKVIELCHLATEGEGSLVVPANFNAPGQVVIAGHAEAVDRAAKLASDPARPDLKARKFIPLRVSAPFHSPLMKGVAERFVAPLQAIRWSPLAFAVVNNLDAKLRDSGDLLPLLRDQIDHPVLWTACAKELARNGYHRFIEMGPGKVLTGLVKRIVDGAELFCLDSTEELNAFERRWKEISA